MLSQVRIAVWLLPFMLCLGILPVFAECVRPVGVDLAVGIREAAPFVTSDPVRGTRGLSVDLWEEVAEDVKRAGFPADYAYVDCDLGDQLDALDDGTLDIVISPMTITAARLADFDFTVQYLGSGLTAAQRKSATIDFKEARETLGRTLTQPGIARAIVIFLALNFMLAFLISRLLNASGEITGKASGITGAALYLFEAVGRTIGLKGVGDGYRSVFAKLLELFMAVIGTVLSATVFGVLTTVFISTIGSKTDLPPRTLPSLRVVTLVDSTAEGFVRDVTLEQSGTPADFACEPLATALPSATCVTVDDLETAVEAVLAEQADAVVGDWAQLIFLSRQPRFAERISVQDKIYLMEPYGWGLSRATMPEGGSDKVELRRALDQALVERMRNPYWRVMVQDYIGAGSISPQ